MPDLPNLTLIIGPQTGLALSLNALIRTLRAPLKRAGLTALPSRVASPLLRRCLDIHRPQGEREAEFTREVRPGPTLLSAVNFLGAPQSGLHKGEMFPGAEVALSGLGQLVGPARIVFCPDNLHNFFLATNSDVLEERVRRHDWATLYELSWADLAKEIIAAVPGCELLVLTPSGAAINSPQVLSRLLGPGARVVPDMFTLMKGAVSQTGVAVLDRMLEEREPDETMLADLYQSFAETRSVSEVEEKLGIDRLTMTLMQQRFDEDLAVIASLPSVEII